jgi:hypothetical protein
MVRTGSEAFPSGHFRMVRSGDRKLGRKLRVMPDAPIHNVAVAPNTEPDAPPKTPPRGMPPQETNRAVALIRPKSRSGVRACWKLA